MKFNKWTVGLAAVGAVSLASVAQAEEKASSVMTAVSSTTLSGYVDTSMNWNIGDGNGNVPNYKYNSPAKQDGFNLNSILISLEKPLDESEWAAGYKIDLMYGPDADRLGTTPAGQLSSNFAIKQAYVALRTPVGNGIDWKLGVFDSPLGYEATETPLNPNFSRSYGHTIEPSTLTGILGSYKVSELVSFSVGIANTTGPIIGGDQLGLIGGGASIGRANPPKAESYKTYMAAVALTAPNDWGFLSGSTLYGGVINGWGGGLTTPTGVQTSLYAGATINTPITGLRTGIAFDYFNRAANINGALGGPESWADSIALYASYQATEKLSVHGRAEYFWESRQNGIIAGPNAVGALTGTVQYDLWKNVISRIELRWDHQLGNIDGIPNGASGPGYYGTPLVSTGGGINGGVPQPGAAGKHDAFTLVANAIYKF